MAKIKESNVGKAVAKKNKRKAERSGNQDPDKMEETIQEPSAEVLANKKKNKTKVQESPGKPAEVVTKKQKRKAERNLDQDPDTMEKTVEEPVEEVATKKKKRKAESSDELPQEKKAKVDESEDVDDPAAETEKKLRERDRRSLFVRADAIRTCNIDKLMKIARGIVDIRRKGKIAYIEFKSESHSEKGYETLRDCKLNGEDLYVDYVGEKSRITIKEHHNEPQKVDPTRLYVGGVPHQATRENIEKLFPKCVAIKIEKAIHGNYRYALVSFGSEEDAKEGFSMKDLKLQGKPLNILFAKQMRNTKQKNNKQKIK